MSTLFNRFIISLTALTISLTAGAQDNAGHEGWYQVEVIIFERNSDSGDEIWPADLNLRYPINWQELKDPHAVIVEGPGEAAETDFSLAGSTSNSEKITAEQTAVDLLRAPFYLLPSSDRHLNADARRLNARPGIKVLFHEAWRQPVTDAATAPWVLISGGEEFDKHHRLEGSINVNVSRYLHVKTNLWLTDYQINAGQSRNQWPDLPLNPVARLQQTPPGPSNQDNQNLQWTDNSDSWMAPDWDLQLSDFLTAEYLPTRIVTLLQSRRMRSNETHYIDHPVLGMMVRVIPYTLPEKGPQTTTGAAVLLNGE